MNDGAKKFHDRAIVERAFICPTHSFDHFAFACMVAKRETTGCFRFPDPGCQARALVEEPQQVLVDRVYFVSPLINRHDMSSRIIVFRAFAPGTPPNKKAAISTRGLRLASLVVPGFLIAFKSTHAHCQPAASVKETARKHKIGELSRVHHLDQSSFRTI
jgi:hypothetical protein